MGYANGAAGERLQLLLHHARHVPYYRDHGRERRRRGDRASPEILENWPILVKQALRENPQAFVAEARSRAGTVRDADERNDRNAAAPLAVARDAGVLVRALRGPDPAMEWRHASRPVGAPGRAARHGVERRRPPFWVWNAGMHQLYMSTLPHHARAVGVVLDALRRYRIRYLFGYASAITALAPGSLEQQGLEAPEMGWPSAMPSRRWVISASAISSVFRCPVRDTYGQAEIVTGASECVHGSMHLWPEVGVTEWMRDELEEPVAPGEAGRMLCTRAQTSTCPDPIRARRPLDTARRGSGRARAGARFPRCDPSRGARSTSS